MGGTIGSSIAPGKSLSYREGVSSLYFHGGPWSKSASGYLGLKFFIEGIVGLVLTGHGALTPIISEMEMGLLRNVFYSSRLFAPLLVGCGTRGDISMRYCQSVERSFDLP